MCLCLSRQPDLKTSAKRKDWHKLRMKKQEMISCGERKGHSSWAKPVIRNLLQAITPTASPLLWVSWLCPQGCSPSLLFLFAQGYILHSQIFLKATKNGKEGHPPRSPGPLPGSAESLLHLFIYQQIKPPLIFQQNKLPFQLRALCSAHGQLCWDNLGFSTFPWEGKCEGSVPRSLQLIQEVFSSLACSRAPWVGNIADVHSWRLKKRCKWSIFCLLGILACFSWNFMHWNSLTAGIMLNYHMLALENFWVA